MWNIVHFAVWLQLPLYELQDTPSGGGGWGGVGYLKISPSGRQITKDAPSSMVTQPFMGHSVGWSLWVWATCMVIPGCLAVISVTTTQCFQVSGKPRLRDVKQLLVSLVSGRARDRPNLLDSKLANYTTATACCIRDGPNLTVQLENWTERDFPGDPVVKSLSFQCREYRFHPLSGNYDPTCYSVAKRKKKERIGNEAKERRF